MSPKVLLVLRMSTYTPYAIDHAMRSMRDVWTTEILGGYSRGVPPLPIPNREVKPAGADGTAMQCGRVGRCPF